MAEVNSFVSDKDFHVLRSCMATVYVGLSVSFYKSSGVNELNNFLRGYEPSLSNGKWIMLFTAVMTSLMVCELRIARLGLFAKGSLIYVELWVFMAPYYWIRSTWPRTVAFLGIATLAVLYFSYRDIQRSRIFLFHLWAAVPLPVLDANAAWTILKKIITFFIAAQVVLMIIILFLLFMIVFLAGPAGLWTMIQCSVLDTTESSRILDFDRLLALFVCLVAFWFRNTSRNAALTEFACETSCSTRSKTMQKTKSRHRIQYTTCKPNGSQRQETLDASKRYVISLNQ